MRPNLRMLVATDLGASGDLAIATATTWVRRHQGTAVALHVARTDDAQQAGVLDRRVREIAGDLADRFERRVERGKAADRILELAKSTRADLIVLGGRDEEHSRWRFGSVAERVVTQAHVPVLIARGQAETGRVVALCDLTDASLVAVAPALEIARATGVTATVVHCIEPPVATEASYAELAARAEGSEQAERREAERRLRALVGDGVNVEVVAGSVVPTLIAVAEAHDAEVVVTASRGRTGISRFVLGSVVASLLREIHRTVLVIHRRS